MIAFEENDWAMATEGDFALQTFRDRASGVRGTIAFETNDRAMADLLVRSR
ncbi:MAG: hypothetical protein LH702_00555 [Phormidesmis sp. CAN_BIN44]|nr:hypothetical protein [Phormidesmis sp. CAN_BIN44]